VIDKGKEKERESPANGGWGNRGDSGAWGATAQTASTAAPEKANGKRRRGSDWNESTTQDSGWGKSLRSSTTLSLDTALSPTVVGSPPLGFGAPSRQDTAMSPVVASPVDRYQPRQASRALSVVTTASSARYTQAQPALAVDMNDPHAVEAAVTRCVCLGPARLWGAVLT
jgi:hypothetical protein